MKNENASAADVVSFYSKGVLPPEHIRHKAKIWMEKIFVSHLFTEMYYNKYHKLPKKEREGGEGGVQMPVGGLQDVQSHWSTLSARRHLPVSLSRVNSTPSSLVAPSAQR